MKFYYQSYAVSHENLDRFLNNLENLASGSYEIVQIFDMFGTAFLQCMVVVKFIVDDSNPPFDEEEIKRKLGFNEKDV